MTEKAEARQVTLDEVKDKVEELVLDAKVQSTFPEWLSRLRSHVRSSVRITEVQLIPVDNGVDPMWKTLV